MQWLLLRLTSKGGVIDEFFETHGDGDMVLVLVSCVLSVFRGIWSMVVYCPEFKNSVPEKLLPGVIAHGEGGCGAAATFGLSLVRTTVARITRLKAFDHRRALEKIRSPSTCFLPGNHGSLAPLLSQRISITSVGAVEVPVEKLRNNHDSCTSAARPAHCQRPTTIATTAWEVICEATSHIALIYSGLCCVRD